MSAHWSTFDLVIHRRSYPSGNQPFIPQPRKAASAPRLRHMEASDPIKFSVQPLQEGAVHIWNWKIAQLQDAEELPA
jgi:hypothetical protein